MLNNFLDLSRFFSGAGLFFYSIACCVALLYCIALCNKLRLWRLMNRTYKSATQRKIHSSNAVGLIKIIFRITTLSIPPRCEVCIFRRSCFYFFCPLWYKHSIVVQAAHVVGLRVIAVPAMLGTVAIIHFAIAVGVL